jgi:deoxyribodipyrimidine photo-lyase
MHIYLFHRDLRLNDNTTLIKQLKLHKKIVPIFIFPPEQIDQNKNKYFSNASVQFMIESLHELSDTIKNKDGKLYFFKGENLKVLQAIHKEKPIESIGFNIDYTPYSVKRDNEIKNWCNDNNIICYYKEDYALYDIIEGQTKKQDGNPYLVYSPFMHHCINNLTVRPIDKFSKFKFAKVNLEKHIIEESEIDKFYIDNPNINVHGGRKNGLKILKNIDKFKDYDKKRDYLTYNTTFLSAHNHFSTVSIREVHNSMIKKTGLIRELIWRDFYYNIIYYFPNIMTKKIYKDKYIKWENNPTYFKAFCTARTGFPLIDAATNQLLTKNFVHNRMRMCQASFLTKHLLIDWKKGEQFYANHLVDYSPIQNLMGWLWASSLGPDPVPYFRIFNPWIQAKKYDKDAEYIKTYLPELKDVPAKDIHKWYDPDVRNKWINKVDYCEPIVVHEVQRKKALKLFKS